MSRTEYTLADIINGENGKYIPIKNNWTIKSITKKDDGIDFDFIDCDFTDTSVTSIYNACKFYKEEQPLSFVRAFTCCDNRRIRIDATELNKKYAKRLGNGESSCILNNYYNNKYLTKNEVMELLKLYENADSLSILINESVCYLEK